MNQSNAKESFLNTGIQLKVLIITIIFSFQAAYSFAPDKNSEIGVLYRLELNEKNTIARKYSNYATDFRILLRKNKINYYGIKTKNDGLHISFKDKDERKNALSLLKNKYNNLFSFGESKTEKYHILLVQISPSGKEQILEASINNIANVLKKRVGLLGIKSKEITKKFPNHIEVKLRGITNFDTPQKVITAISKLELHKIEEKSNAKKPGRTMVKDTQNNSLVISKRKILSSKNITDSKVLYEQALPALKIILDDQGEKKLSGFTEKNPNKKIAIVLVETVHEMQKTKSGKLELMERTLRVIIGSITLKDIQNNEITFNGFKSFNQAHELSLLLNSGLILSPYYLIEEQVIN